MTFAEIKDSNQEQPTIQQDNISEEDFQSVQGESIPTDILPAQVSPVTPRAEIVQHTGLTDQLNKMAAQTPAKRGLMDGVESEGKKSKDKEGDDDVNMGGTEEAEGEQPKWKPRPVADPMDPIELGAQALFISKEKSDRMT